MSLKVSPNKSRKIWFCFVLLYLAFDYGRPQDTFNIIAVIRPSMLLILLLSGLLIVSSEITKVRDTQVKWIWLFLLLLILHIPFAKNSYRAFLTAKSQLLYMPFILSTIVCVNSLTRLKKMINLTTLLMAYVAIYSIFHNGRGPGNYFLDENDLSLYIDTYLPFCYFLFLSDGDKKNKLIYAISMVAGVAAIVISFSRGGLIGFISMIAFAWWVSPKKIASLILICAFVSIIYFIGGYKYEKEMSTSTQIEQGTAKTRIESWKSAWRMFLAHPLGVGGNNFQVWFPEYQTEYFRRNMWGRVAHSLWFTLLAELGIPGIIVYVGLARRNFKDLLFLKQVSRENNTDELHYLYHLSLAFLASLIGFFTAASFLSVLYYAHYWYVTGLIVASVRIIKSMRESALVQRNGIV